MTRTPTEAELVAGLAREQGVSEDAVKTVLEALRRGGGTMAQFTHAEFGGMSQWSSGMTMVGDIFNDSLRAKLGTIAAKLSDYLRDHPDERQRSDNCIRMTSPSATILRAGQLRGGPKILETPLRSDPRTTCATRCFLKRDVWSSTTTGGLSPTTPATTRFPASLRHRVRIPLSLLSASMGSSAFRNFRARTRLELQRSTAKCGH